MAVDEVALTLKRQRVMAALATTTAGQLARRWDSLADHHEGAEGRWTALAAPVVAAAQGRAVDLQAAYLGALLGSTVTFDRDEVLGKAAVNLREPFIAMGRALNSGEGIEAALEAGKLRAAGVGESSVHWAARATNSAAEDRVVGWRRTITGNACEFCRTVSTQRYRTSDSASFGHLRCDCGVVPIYGQRDPGRIVNSRMADVSS